MICTKCGETKESEFSPTAIKWHRKRCKTCLANAHHEYYKMHKQKYLIYNRTRYLRYHNEPEFKARRNAQNEKSYTRIREKVLSHYSEGKIECAICGFNDIRALCLDHIIAVGMTNSHKKAGKAFLRFIIRNNYPRGFQVLCANCNMIKEYIRRKQDGLIVCN